MEDFGLIREDVTGKWRDFIKRRFRVCVPNIIGMNKSFSKRWVRHVARMGKTRSAYRVSLGQPEGKGPFGRPRRRQGYNIKRDLQAI